VNIFSKTFYNFKAIYSGIVYLFWALYFVAFDKFEIFKKGEPFLSKDEIRDIESGDLLTCRARDIRQAEIEIKNSKNFLQ
jgi:hypothetical protein